MPRMEEKKQIVAEVKQKLDEAMLVVFTNYRGLTVKEMTELRNSLRAPGVEYKIIKNTMLGFALEQSGFEDLKEQITGPNAVLFSTEDPVGPAKALFDFSKGHKELEIKVGILEGQVIQADKVKDLAELPSREQLLAQVAGTMQAPISSLVYVLNANLTGLVRVLDQVRELKAAG
ncbi:MAG TPA: 50S ribosomal protein L10 [Syntrophomonadaceae bacterium]|nr:50S ribosomal protein L10 [Syntrophomonadaceae bacterium]